ncbi:unnamed protein product [Urochloa humidicola]
MQRRAWPGTSVGCAQVSGQRAEAVWSTSTAGWHGGQRTKAARSTSAAGWCGGAAASARRRPGQPQRLGSPVAQRRRIQALEPARGGEGSGAAGWRGCATATAGGDASRPAVRRAEGATGTSAECGPTGRRARQAPTPGRGISVAGEQRSGRRQ